MTTSPEVVLTRRVVIAASHRLHASKLSAKENQELFGKCNHVHGHGHNYQMEISLKGPVDPMTGVVFDLARLKQIIHDEVELRMDHKHLNLDVKEFKEINPTVENIAVTVWKWMEAALPPGLLYRVKVYETENNMAIYKGRNH